ncbi:MAG: c-type cytochrome [Paracoccaceae bacterium]
MRNFGRSLVLGSVALATQAISQEAIGERVYNSRCAVCHGTDGRGTGPYAELLTVALPDLTRLEAANDGDFPFERIYKTIDGRFELGAHGTRDMPIWSDEFNEAAVERYNPFFGSTDAEAFVSGRILALITYLQSIQQ